MKWLRDKMNNLLARAVITAIRQDEGKVFAQVKTRGGVRSDVEVLQQYGLRSIPLPGSRGILYCYGGDKDNASIDSVDDKRYGKFPLEEGDVMLYNSNGSRTIFRGDTVITTAEEKYEVNIQDTKFTIDSGKIEMEVAGKICVWDGSTLSVDGAITATGNIDSDATITGATDVVAGTVSGIGHVHAGVTPGAGSTAPPTP